MINKSENIIVTTSPITWLRELSIIMRGDSINPHIILIDVCQLRFLAFQIYLSSQESQSTGYEFGERVYIGVCCIMLFIFTSLLVHANSRITRKENVVAQIFQDEVNGECY